MKLVLKELEGEVKSLKIEAYESQERQQNTRSLPRLVQDEDEDTVQIDEIGKSGNVTVGYSTQNRLIGAPP